jgi:parallel beta-helix repeat protein
MNIYSAWKLVRKRLVIGSSLLVIGVLAIFTIGLYQKTDAFSLVFVDDFESYALGSLPAGFTDTVPSGTWTVVDDGTSQVLEQSDPLLASPADPIVFAPGTADDMIYEAKVKIKDTDGYAGLVFRAADRDNLYLYQIYSADDEIKLFKREAGVWTLLTAAPYTFDVDTFYRLAVIAVGDEIIGSVDSEPVFEFVDSTFTAGSFGFRTHLTRAHFDDAVVVEPPFDLRGDNFENYLLDSDASPFWAGFFGTWEVKDDGVTQVMRQSDAGPSGASDPVLLSADTVSPISDFTLEADVKVLSGSNAGVVFRAQDHDNLYLFRINTSADNAALYRRVAGTYTLLDSAPLPLANGTFYSLKVIAIGDQLAGSVDGAPMAQAVDATFASGAFGFRTNAATADFDNLSIFEGPFSFVVDDDGLECPDRDFADIQSGIDFTPEGQTLVICAGTYDEQLSLDKNISLIGNDAANRPVIKPTALVANSTRLSNGSPVAAIVLADAGVELNLRDLVIDGATNGIGACGAPDPRLMGVFFHNASGSVISTEIINIEYSALPTCGRGVGLLAESDAVGDSSVTVQDAQVLDYQKIGILAYGLNTELSSINSTVRGWGPTADVVQFGIRFKAGARGIVMASDISGNDYTPGSDRGVGVHITTAGADINIISNDIHDNEVGVLVEDTDSGSLFSNTINDSTDTAIEIDPSSDWAVTANKIDATGGSAIKLLSVSDSRLFANQVSGAGGSGIVLGADSGNNSSGNSFIANSIFSSGLRGIVLQPTVGSGSNVSGNRLIANQVSSSGDDGIGLLAGSTNEVSANELLFNKVDDSGEQGIHLQEENSGQVDDNILRFNQVDNSSKNGIKVKKADDNIIDFNQINNSGRNGIRLAGGSNNNQVNFNQSLGNGNGATTFDLNCAPGACLTTTQFGNIFGTASPPGFWQ